MNLKNLILTNWNWWRITRLLLSIIFVVNGVLQADNIVLTGGGFLFFHSIINPCMSCGGTNCEFPNKKNDE
jgi:hypothetical protein